MGFRMRKGGNEEILFLGSCFMSGIRGDFTRPFAIPYAQNASFGFALRTYRYSRLFQITWPARARHVPRQLPAKPGERPLQIILEFKKSTNQKKRMKLSGNVCWLLAPGIYSLPNTFPTIPATDRYAAESAGVSSRFFPCSTIRATSGSAAIFPRYGRPSAESEEGSGSASKP